MTFILGIFILLFSYLYIQMFIQTPWPVSLLGCKNIVLSSENPCLFRACYFWCFVYLKMEEQGLNLPGLLCSPYFCD